MWLPEVPAGSRRCAQQMGWMKAVSAGLCDKGVVKVMGNLQGMASTQGQAAGEAAHPRAWTGEGGRTQRRVAVRTESPGGSCGLYEECSHLMHSLQEGSWGENSLASMLLQKASRGCPLTRPWC